MADDGLLLNFETPSAAAFTPRPTFRGGSWKDRLAAKRASGPRKTTPKFFDVREQDEELILPGGNPNKRLKTEHRRELRDSLPKTTNGEVISSLFTYNPTSTLSRVDSTAAVEEASTEPSNAPLNDELASFTTLGLSASLASHLLSKLKIKAPTAIQTKAIQQLCSTDKDAFIQAQTGSGKTLAYLLPIVQRISHVSRQMKDSGEGFSRESGLFAIVLAPTRELSKQISAVLEGLLSCCNWIVSGSVIGGEKKKSEKARLRKGLNVLVATPGRLADHLSSTEVLDVSKVRWLVLDEGDRLMELGFEQDVQKIVSVLNLRSRKTQENPIPGLPHRRTTVLCSATIKADVDQLKNIALKDALSISVDPSENVGGQDHIAKEQKFSAPAQLKQSYAIVPAKQRLVTLVATLRQSFKRKGSVMKCIVFMTCADTVDFHFEVLTRSASYDSGTKKSEQDEDGGEHARNLIPPALSKSDKIPQGNTISEIRTQGKATAISSKDVSVQLFRLHGSLQQVTRTSTLKSFITCSDPSVLVCTDVASRGLDLPNVDLVIEYDAPFSKDDHLHRIGRTARAGNDGRAMIFLMPGCEEMYVDILEESGQRNVARHEADEILRKGFSAAASAVVDKGWEQRATDWQLDVERWALENPKHLEQARRAFQSHIRAYATHVAAERKIFDMKQLHLGHLAKAFALRDKPGSIRVPGSRPGNDASKTAKEARKTQASTKEKLAGTKRSHGDDVSVATDAQDARKKMMAKMRAMAGASEFNLG